MVWRKKNIDPKLLRKVSAMISEWEQSDELCSEFAERLIVFFGSVDTRSYTQQSNGEQMEFIPAYKHDEKEVEKTSVIVKRFFRVHSELTTTRAALVACAEALGQIGISCDNRAETDLAGIATRTLKTHAEAIKAAKIDKA